MTIRYIIKLCYYTEHTYNVQSHILLSMKYILMVIMTFHFSSPTKSTNFLEYALLKTETMENIYPIDFFL